MTNYFRGITKADGDKLDAELEKMPKKSLVGIIKHLMVINYNQTKLIERLKNEGLSDKSE